MEGDGGVIEGDGRRGGRRRSFASRRDARPAHDERGTRQGRRRREARSPASRQRRLPRVMVGDRPLAASSATRLARLQSLQSFIS